VTDGRSRSDDAQRKVAAQGDQFGDQQVTGMKPAWPGDLVQQRDRIGLGQDIQGQRVRVDEAGERAEHAQPGAIR
jgi:hypothetical protein